MKILLVTFFCAGITLVSAQSPHKQYDFSGINPKEIDRVKLEKQWDSIYYAMKLDSISLLGSYVRDHEYMPRYVALDFGYTQAKASLKDIKRGLASLGFDDASDVFHGFQFGIDIRGKRWLFGYLLNGYASQKFNNADMKVKVDGFQFELALGYDVVNLHRLHFYPQLSLGVQDLSIEAERKTATTDIITFEDVVLKPAGTDLSRTSFALGYGAELDYHLAYSDSRRGIILGARYGGVALLSKGKFTLNGSDAAFQTSDQMCQSFFQFIVKIYVKSPNWK